jgi:hypothetical protein
LKQVKAASNSLRVQILFMALELSGDLMALGSIYATQAHRKTVGLVRGEI